MARSAHSTEQSVAGGMFVTITQFGTAIGLAITTTIKNEITDRESGKLGVSPNDQTTWASLQGFKSAQWGGFGFAMAGKRSIYYLPPVSIFTHNGMLTVLEPIALVLSVLFMRNVGVIGGDGKTEPVENASSEEPSQVPSTVTSVAEKEKETV